jgi:hypothetical protein
MKGIQIYIPALLKKTQEMLNDDMVTVYLSIADEAEDQGEVSPPFLHFEAFMNDGSVRDYESIDEVRTGFEHQQIQ